MDVGAAIVWPVETQSVHWLYFFPLIICIDNRVVILGLFWVVFGTWPFWLFLARLLDLDDVDLCVGFLGRGLCSFSMNCGH